MSVLEAHNVTVRFGGLVAVENVSFAVEKGQIYAVIGPNGAGKTTLFNAVTGIYGPSDGRVEFAGREQFAPLTAVVLMRFAFAFMAVAIGVVVGINIETLWQAAIVDNYAFLKPFPWSTAAVCWVSTMWNLPISHLWIPFIVGGFVGLGASMVSWWRRRRSSDFIARCGVARTFQNIRLFNELSLVQNVLVGMDYRMRTGFWSALLRLRRFHAERRACHAQAEQLLDFVGLADRADHAAGSLPYGFRRRLEIARALAGKPAVILLDEPAAGMNPSEVVTLMALIRRVRDAGTTVVLIEHHMRLVMGVSDRILVLQYGRQIAEGTSAEIRANPKCVEAYLGSEDHG